MDRILKHSIATLSLLSFLAFLPVGCDTVCNDLIPPKDFTILSFEVSTLDLDSKEVNPSEFLPYDEVIKVIRIKEMQTLELSDKVEKAFSIPGMSYACSPVSPKSATHIERIQIINSETVTLSDGKVLDIGDDLSTLFGINYFNASGSVDIATFFSKKREIYYDDYFKLNWLFDPKKELPLDFSILIIMEDGKEFSINNEKLSIK